jgi:hypothetical protein
MTDKIRELVKGTINADVINALCDVVDEQQKRIKLLEQAMKKKE